MLFSLFAALSVCMRAELSLGVSSSTLAPSALASSGSLAHVGGAPLGSHCALGVAKPHHQGVGHGAPLSQGALSERMSPLYPSCGAPQPLAHAPLRSCALPASPSVSEPPLLVPHINAGGHSGLEPLTSKLPLFQLSTYHTSLHQLLLDFARVSGRLLHHVCSWPLGHLSISDHLPSSLVEGSLSGHLTLLSTSEPIINYKNHYMIDWLCIVDFEYVWARWFPVSLAILPRSRWGPPPSKPFYRLVGCFFWDIIFTPKGRNKLAIATSLVCVAFTFHGLVEETSHEARIEVSLVFLCSYIVTTQLLSLFMCQDFTLPLPFGIGECERRVFGADIGAPRVRHVGLPINFTRLFVCALISINLPLGHSVCVSCAGNDPSCTGDSSTCVLALALLSNRAVIAGTVGAAATLTMGVEGKHILPLSWLQILKPAVLNTLQSLANKSPSGTPLDVKSLSIMDLSASIAEGRISVSDGRYEFIRRMADDSTSVAMLNKMEKICAALPMRAEDARIATPLSRLQNSGALSFVFALSSQIVHRLSNSSKASLTITDASSSSALSAASVSMEIKRPQSCESFSHMLIVWQSVLSATGLSNAVVLGPFLVDVVYDIIPLKGWKIAFEHFLLYISKIDSGCGWQLATATSLGSNDTFLHKAERAAGGPPPSPSPSVPIPGAKVPIPSIVQPAQLVWNGKFNSDPLARPCAAHNLGQDHIRLNKDGSCPHNHCCDRFITGKGPGAQCRSTGHTRSSCDHADKSVSKSN